MNPDVAAVLADVWTATLAIAVAVLVVAVLVVAVLVVLVGRRG